MFQRTKICTGVLVALGAVLAVPAAPVFAQTSDRVEITGSRIKRIAGEGPSAVEVITRADIERKGVTSTNDLLRSLSYMSSFNDELISNSPNTTGAAGAGFRGLSSDQTVVLLNGRRLANYGFDGAFVNLNTIPLGAIERVEVLKDGAAAIYGADAIGGVTTSSPARTSAAPRSPATTAFHRRATAPRPRSLARSALVTSLGPAASTCWPT